MSCTAIVGPPLPPPDFSEQEDTITVKDKDQTWELREPEDWINGEVRPLSYRVKGVDGSYIQHGTAGAGMSVLNFFMWMFPLSHLSVIVSLKTVN